MAERSVERDEPETGGDVMRDGDGVDDDVEPVPSRGHPALVGGDDQVVAAQPAGVAGLVGPPR